MKLIYLTASLPHGANEAFIIPEIEALTRLGHEILLVPRSPAGALVHGEDLVRLSRCRPLFSLEVVGAAARESARHPARALNSASRLVASRSVSQLAKNLLVLPKALWLAECATNWGASHIHCHWASTTATMAMLASEFSGLPWSLTTHRWDIVEDNLLQAKIRSASFVRFISEDGLMLARTVGVDLGPNSKLLRMGVLMPETTPRRFSHAPVVLCPARLDEVKGHRHLIQAWSVLRSLGVEAELRLAGDGELRPRIESQIRDLGLESSVRLLGAVPHKRLLEMYDTGTVSIVVLPSVDLGNGYHEGVPVALIEAMSYGIPVIATPTGGIAELVAPGTGILVPPGNAAALAGSLRTLIESPQLAETIGSMGRDRAREVHDVNKIAAELAAAFQLASAGGQSPLPISAGDLAARSHQRSLSERSAFPHPVE